MTAGEISLEVGIAAAVLATVIGVVWGSIAGYFGGPLDAVMMRIVDAVLSIPVLFLALVIVALITPTEPILILVVALTSWLTTSTASPRRGAVAAGPEYVQAMRVMGGSSARAVFRHIAPNSIGTIMVNLSFQVATRDRAGRRARYLGLGIRPPQEDWGAMLSSGVTYVSDGYWWLILPAGVCIVIVITSFIWIGEGLRDAVEVSCSATARRPRHPQRYEDAWHPCSRSRTCTPTSAPHRHGARPGRRDPGRRGRRVPRHRGESGSGKTMTALSVMQLLPPGGRIAGGQILLDGKMISTLDDDEMRHVRGNEIGMIFQDPMTSLNPTMTIGDQIAETVRLHRGAGPEVAQAGPSRCSAWLACPARRAGQPTRVSLSGGMRQRVMIAMALAAEPRLLIADEPTTALDVTIQKQILELLDDLRQRLGMAVILVTHDLGVIAGRADRAVVMYAGRVMEETGTPRLFGNPRHPYTEALFEALPEKAADVSGRLYNIPGQPPDLTRPPAGCKFAPRCRYARDSAGRTSRALGGNGTDHRYRCFFPVGRASDDAGGPRSHRGGRGRRSGPPRSRRPTPAAARHPAPGEELPGHLRACCSARSARSAPSPTSTSRSSPARPSAWSASPAAARPRSAG